MEVIEYHRCKHFNGCLVSTGLKESDSDINTLRTFLSGYRLRRSDKFKIQELSGAMIRTVHGSTCLKMLQYSKYPLVIKRGHGKSSMEVSMGTSPFVVALDGISLVLGLAYFPRYHASSAILHKRVCHSEYFMIFCHLCKNCWDAFWIFWESSAICFWFVVMCAYRQLRWHAWVLDQL